MEAEQSDELRTLPILGKKQDAAQKFRMTATDSPTRISYADRKSKRMTSMSTMSVMSAAKYKGFKEWYSNYLKDAKDYFELLSDQYINDKDALNENIKLSDLFGTTPQTLIPSIMLNARKYERSKSSTDWYQKSQLATPQTSTPSPNKLNSPSSPNKLQSPLSPSKLQLSEASSPIDEEEDGLSYRILNIFDEGLLERVNYETHTMVASGKPHDLIDALIFPLVQKPTYTDIFFMSYRFFVPALTVLESLIEWYNVEVQMSAPLSEEQFLKKNRRQIQSRVVKCILIWIKKYWQDFQADKRLYKLLLKFINSTATVSFGDCERMTQNVREQRLSFYTLQYIPPISIKRISQNIDKNKLNVNYGLSWEPEEFAVQLILVDHMLFQQIKPASYIHLLMPNGVPTISGSADGNLKVLLEYVSWFRLISSFCASLIMKEDSPKKKANVIKRWIKIAKECKRLNSFNMVFAIVHALKRPSVASQSTAWEQVFGKATEMLSELELIVNPDDSFAHFWENWGAMKPPATPFLGAFISILIDCDRELSTYEDNNSVQIFPELGESINMRKFTELFKIIHEIEQFRTFPYSESIITRLDSASECGFPLPAQIGPGSYASVDYTGYILTNIQDYGQSFLLEDKVLDSISLKY